MPTAIAAVRRTERWLLAGAIFALLLRLLLVFRYRFDSDEPQHMHVAWGWAHGLMQYRDVFDNHMPLFHLLSAPLFRIVGDDPRALFLARLAVLPLFVAAVVLAWAIAQTLFGQRTALWSAVLVAVFPPFFLGTLEYRADDLWVVFWLATILILLSRVPLLPRSFIAGLTLGLAFAVSMKSILCALAIASAALATLALTWRRAPSVSRGTLLKCAAVIALAASAVPSISFLAFALAGAWRPFAYCVFLHNRVPYEHSWRLLWFVPLYPIIRNVALRIARSAAPVDAVRRRLFVFLVCSGFFLALVAFWPMVALESYLPFYPLAVVLITPGLVGSRYRVLPRAALAASFVALVVTGAPWADRARDEVALVRQVLELTRPSDPVMDLKGETLFRRRPYWLVLEAITNVNYRRGVLPDRIAETLERTGTAVVATKRLPPKSARFVDQNYLPWGRVWVAGRQLACVAGFATTDVEVHVPAKYIVITERGRVHAMIDGIPVGRGLDLKPGRHSVAISDEAPRAALIWSGVLRSHGFAPEINRLLGQPNHPARELSAALAQPAHVFAEPELVLTPRRAEERP